MDFVAWYEISAMKPRSWALNVSGVIDVTDPGISTILVGPNDHLNICLRTQAQSGYFWWSLFPLRYFVFLALKFTAYTA